VKNKCNRRVVAATFLTPLLDFYQINHTEPLLRHHRLIFVACFGQDAGNGGEMSRSHCQV